MYGIGLLVVYWGFKMGVEKMFLGLGIVMFGVLLLINSIQIIHLIDNKQHSLILFENTTDTSFAFNFDKDYISKIYKISEGEKIYKNYLNLYTDEFKDNTTIYNLTAIQLNNDLYIPENKSYHISCMLIEDTLKDLKQEIELTKSAGLKIDKITLEYKGADYSKKEMYEWAIFLLVMLIICLGILLGLYD